MRVILSVECNQCPLLCAILFNLRKVLLLLLEIPRGRIKSQSWNSHKDGGEGFKQTNLLWEEYGYFLEHIPEKKAILYQDNLLSNSSLCVTTDTIDEYKYT